MKKDYKRAIKNGLVLWVPLQYINFRYVPMRWRVLFIDVVHFFWYVSRTFALAVGGVQPLNLARVQGYIHVCGDDGIEERR